VSLLPVLLGSLAAVAVLMTLTALVAWRLDRVAVVDVAWGFGFVLVALASALIGDEPVRWLLLAMVGVWGLRLTWHIGKRQLGHAEEDPRYARMLGGSARGRFSVAVRRVFLVQGLAMWFVSLPVQVAAVVGTRWTWLVWVGVVVWAVGLVFESLGDAQLAAYKRDPDRPPVMDRGLWGWTRHPNYFGDSCVWWGIWVTGALAGGPLPALTIVSPAVMTWFLVFATGARLLESSMMKRPGYPEYAERTSMFFPLPPRRTGRRPA
jgi:steroid 5-alpha reductase family enzyme